MNKVFDLIRKIDLSVCGISSEYYQQIVSTNLDAYDVIAESYDNVVSVHAAQEQVHIDLAISFCKSNKRTIADIGSAGSRDYLYWKQKGYNYWGLDMSPQMIARGKLKYPEANLVQGDLVTTPLMADSCAFVWASSVLQHIPKVLMPVVMKNFATGLAPGGIFYANYRPVRPNVDKEGILKSTEYIRSDNGSNEIYRFTAHYDEGEMIELIQAAGLKVIIGSHYQEIYGKYNSEKGLYLPSKNIVLAIKD